MTTAAQAPSSRWPDAARPERSPVYSRSEIAIPAAAADVFAWLIDAVRWPEWYSQCGSVQILSGSGPALDVGTTFRWTVIGVAVTTTVEECVPTMRLAWSGTGLGAAAYHSWDIQPTSGGCRVITEETQRGPLPSLARVVMRPLLRWTQVRWLDALARVAVTGRPPGR